MWGGVTEREELRRRDERSEPGEETGEDQGKGRRRRKVNREVRKYGCGFVQERDEKRWEKIQT